MRGRSLRVKSRTGCRLRSGGAGSGTCLQMDAAAMASPSHSISANSRWPGLGELRIPQQSRWTWSWTGARYRPEGHWRPPARSVRSRTRLQRESGSAMSTGRIAALFATRAHCCNLSALAIHRLLVIKPLLTVSPCGAPANPHGEMPSCSRAACNGRKLRGCGSVHGVSGARRE